MSFQDQRVKLGQEQTFYLKQIFYDVDREDLSLSAYISLYDEVTQQARSQEDLILNEVNAWISYDPYLNCLKLKTQLRHDTINKAMSLFNITYKITIQAMDQSGGYSRASFYLSLENHKPSIGYSPLQNQFHSKVRQVYVNEHFFFDIDYTAFLDPDGDELKYTAHLSHERGGYAGLPAWLYFDSQTRNLKGEPPSGTLGQTYTVLLRVTDGYFWNEQTFTFTVKFTLAFLLSKFGQIIGPLTFLFTFYTFKNAIYLICCKKKYIIHNKLSACAKQPFYHVIPLIRNMYIEGSAFWKEFIFQQRAKGKNAEQVMRTYINREFQITDPARLTADINSAMHCLMESPEFLVKCSPTEAKNISALEHEEGAYTFRLISQLQFSPVQYQNLDVVLSFFVYSTILRVCAPARQMFKVLVAKGRKLNGIDWFHKYVKSLEHRNRADLASAVFPTVRLNHSLIKMDLLQIMNEERISLTLTQEESTLNQEFQVYSDLVCWGLLFHIYGFNFSDSVLQKSFGISLFASSASIQLIRAYHKKPLAKDSRSMKRFKLMLKMDRQNIPLHQMRNLPNWLQYDIQHNAIVLFGIPEIYDSGDVVIV